MEFRTRWRNGESILVRNNLRHLCQKYFGRSPMEHLTWLRMKRAAFLLERTNQKISDDC